MKCFLRFSTLLGVGLVGFLLGLLLSGLMMSHNLYLKIAQLATASGFIILLVAYLALESEVETHSLKEDYHRITENKRLVFKILFSIQLQLKNFRELFITSPHRSSFIMVIFMFFFTHMGQICPLDMIAMVYSLGEPFKWSAQFRSYYGSGILLALAIQSLVTVRLLNLMNLSAINITRFGILIGFVATFFLALATKTWTLILGAAISTFIIVANPAIQSMTTSLVKESQIGCMFGVLGAVQGLAESGLINIVLFTYTRTRHILNGACFFVLTVLLAIDLVLAMIYKQPTATERIQDDQEKLLSRHTNHESKVTM